MLMHMETLEGLGVIKLDTPLSKTKIDPDKQLRLERDLKKLKRN